MNPAFSKTEAMLNGYEEAIVLTNEGKVSEGSAENLFMVRKGQLVTPGVDSDILEGITRAGIIQLAREELGVETQVRDRSTAASCTSPTRSSCAAPAPRSRRSPRSTIARSATGASARSRQRIMSAYFDAVRGRTARLQRLGHARSTEHPARGMLAGIRVARRSPRAVRQVSEAA